MLKKRMCGIFAAMLFILCACTGSAESFKARLAEAEKAGYNLVDAPIYASSTHSLQTFIKRLAEAEASSDHHMRYEATYRNYAKSIHSFESFRERYYEARDEASTYFNNGEAEELYAASTHSLQTFKERYTEAIMAFKDKKIETVEGVATATAENVLYALGPEYYAASTHSLQTFMARYAEAVNDNAYVNFGPHHLLYAASNHSL